jgi:hypothetical protein
MKERNAGNDRSEADLDFAHLPEAEGWSNRGRGSRKTVWFMAGFGLLAIVAGVGLLFGDEGRLAGASALAFGATALVVAPALRHRASDGGLRLSTVQTDRPEAGVGFLYSRHRRKMIVAGGACFSLAALFMVVAPDTFGIGAIPPGAIRAIGVVGTLFFGFCAIAGTRMKAVPQVVLTPTGVLNEAGHPRSFVPWDAIHEIRAYTINVEPLVGIYPTDSSLVQVSARGRFITRMNRALGPELAYPVRGVQTDPAVLLGALLHYHRNPQDRHELATERGLRRLELAATSID